MRILLMVAVVCGMCAQVMAQCSTGEVEVYIEVTTDQYGYEAYWELVPNANNCGAGTIFAGGNSGQVGCNGAGDRNATNGNGYGANTTITEGPWCLTEGADYKIISIDDYADGGTSFTVNIEGFDTESFTSTGGNDVFSFTASAPTHTDAAITELATLGYVTLPDVAVSAKVLNDGASTITSLTMEYIIDNGTPVTHNFTGLNQAYGQEETYTFPASWTPADTGWYQLDVRIIAVNGAADDVSANDWLGQQTKVAMGIPNIVDNYIAFPDSVTFETIANSADGVSTPRDLDFHPDLTRNELWVINKETENTGGSTVTIFDADKPGQTIEHRQDGNAWHFMSLPTGIAFGDNTNFATSPGVGDANHQGGTFTGPTLWSSDMSIYGVVGNPPTSADNGSHLDMLHGSPYSMGIAHEVDNVYWIFDSHYEHLVRYDFQDDHGPGQHYHGDALVHRYTEVELTRNGTHVPSHMVLDKETGWLYISDNANARVLRVNINTGTVKGTMPLINEGLTEHIEIENVTWEVYISTGFTSPTGIDVVGDRLLVSDYATGKISIYDISGSSAQLVGDITTGANELMGIKVGPDGFIWYVDAGTNEVRKIETYVPPTDPVGIAANNTEAVFQVFPQPAHNQLTINASYVADEYTTANVYNMFGQVVFTGALNNRLITLDVANLSTGTYVVELTGDGVVQRKPVLIAR